MTADSAWQSRAALATHEAGTGEHEPGQAHNAARLSIMDASSRAEPRTMSPAAESPSPLQIIDAIDAHDGFAERGLPAMVREWLERSLGKARYPRLDQAGHANTRLALAQVFIDIEAGPSPTGPTREPDQDTELDPGIVAYMLGKQPELLDLRPEQRCDNQLVLIGGPGQGKSTTSQYLVQIHRTALLRSHGGALADDAREIVDEIARHVADEMPGWPVQPCIPAHIELGKLAAWMVRKSVEPERAMTGFLCEQIGDSGSIPDNDLHILLELVPWLVVFDGLDEVPASGGRDLVIAAMQAFRRLLAERGTRVLMLATTRPQGYAGELGSHLSTAYLQPLSRQRALAYARKLIDLCYLPGQRETLYDRMKEACDEQATARLMHSPLQVTIMAALVHEVGRPPHQRWRLFSEYYRVIYQREMQRPNSPAGLLRDHRTHIDKIHHQVGLLLQVESERSGGTEALLDSNQLRAVVDRHLHEEGFAENERESLVEEMVQVATDRLVFLVSPQQDRYGFEIRSLQEFMAAGALMDGREEYVKERLLRIAPLFLWRNVLLFAAGRCASQRHMRDFLVNELLDSLEQTDNSALDGTRRASALLALDLIEDGSFDEWPAHLEGLARRAVEILALPLHPGVEKLVALPQDKVRAEVRRYFETRWQGHVHERSGWLGLSMLAEADEDWASELAQKHWPTGDKQALQTILSSLLWRGYRFTGEWLASRILDSLGSIAPEQITHAPWLPSGTTPGFPDSARPRLALIADLVRYDFRAQSGFDGIKISGVRVSFSSLENRALQKFDINAFDATLEHPGLWQAWISAVRFCKEPTHERLALELEALAQGAEMTEFRRALSRLPWPLGACLAQVSSIDELRVLAQRARTGELGQAGDWRTAERRWFEQGIDAAALFSADKQWPRCGLTDGFVPHPAVLDRVNYSDGTSLQANIKRLLHTFMEAYQRQPIYRPAAAEFVWSLINDFPGALDRDVLSPEALRHLLQDLQLELELELSISPALLSALLRQALHDPAWIAVLDRLRSSIHFFWLAVQLMGRKSVQELAQLVTELYQRHPGSPGVVALLADWAPQFPQIAVETQFELPPLSTVEDTAARYHLGVLYLAQHTMEPDDARAWIGEVAEQVTNNPWLLMRALHHPFVPTLGADAGMDRSSLEERERRRALAIDLLTVVHEQAPDDEPDTKEQLLSAIHDHWVSRASGLELAEVWNQLGLSAPSPNALSNTASMPSGLGMLARTRIERIHIRDIRCIQDITIELAARPDSMDRGQWIVLVGENGTGKSSILRGLVLALAAPDVAAGLVADSSASLVRTGKDAGEIEARIQGATFRARLRIEEGREELVRLKDGPQADRPWLFAYGCGRGSALGGPDREVPYTETASVITLFDDKASLLSTETWLKLLQLDALQFPEKHKARLDMVLATLKDILPGVDDIDIDSQGVWLTGEYVGERTPLSGLSDGYITTIGWITDFMARWLNRAARRGMAVTPDFPRRMEALVLVDEIDLHLHPRWQRDIISDLRNIFPRVSFVVTTHNPLTLLGARPGEIFVVRRAPAGDEQPGGPIEVVPCDPPEGMRADQVLTGEWFGLASTLDPDSLELLEEHRQMLRQKVPAGDPTRQALEQRIRERLGHFAETPLEQLAQEVAAEVVDESYSGRSPAEKLALRGRLKDIIRERRQGRGNREE
jgi:hypothetical protein